MSERDDRAASERDPAEGVRIIGAEEAQAALEAGEAAGRRPEDQLRFGDVPPAPPGPRPQHRFPLPDSVDPARAVDLPPLAPRSQPPPRSWSPPPPPVAEPEMVNEPDAGPEEPDAGWEEQEVEPVTEGWAAEERGWAPGDLGYESRVPDSQITQGPTHDTWAPLESTSQPAPAPQPEAPSRTAEPEAASWTAGPDDHTSEMSLSPIPDEGINLTGSHSEMPHWADPPTGEVPRLRFDEEEASQGEDDDAWRSLASTGARWRHEDDWDDVDSVSDLADDFDTPHGALDQTRSEESDLFSFDADFERVTSRPSLELPVGHISGGDDDGYEDEGGYEDYEPAPRHRGVGAASDAAEGLTAAAATRGSTTTRIPTSSEAARRRAVDGSGRPGSRSTAPPVRAGGGDFGGRLGVGLGLVVLLVICYAVGAKALLALAAIVVATAAAEAYGMTRKVGFKPATLLGLVGSVGCVLATYWKGLEAIPIVAALFFAATMLWFVLGIERSKPVINVAVTVMVFVWVGILGSFAAVLLNHPHGKGAFLGTVVVAVAADILAYLVGRSIGSRPIAPNISPNKTLEGYIAGLIGALVVGAIIGKELTPWAGIKHGLVLGLVIGLIAPAGDLFESLLKRDLGIKDSGSVLGGHGGLLDRFDAILVALPLAYFVLTYFKI